MRIPSVREAFDRGEPLVELWIKFRAGIDYQQATELLDGLGPDIEVHFMDGYGDPALRCANATAACMKRLFNVEMARRSISPEFPEGFMWECVEIREWPPELAGLIHEIGITQPGGLDDGQAFPGEVESG